MKQVVLVGSGAVAAEITSYIEDGSLGNHCDFIIKGYLEFSENKEAYWSKYDYRKPILGDIDTYQIDEEDYFIICIADIQFRQKIIDILKIRNAKFLNFIHPSAIIARTANIGIGNIIYPFCQIGPKAKLGDFNIMTHNTTISHDCTIGDNNFIGGDGFCGYVNVGNNNFFGVRSIVIPHVNIENSNCIQAGMIIDKNIQSEATVFFRYKEKVVIISSEN